MRQDTKTKETITTAGAETKNEMTTQDAPEIVDNYRILYDDINIHINEFIDQFYCGKSKEDLKQDRAFFPMLVDYLYNNYICKLLNNKNNKNRLYEDIFLLDDLFSIYTNLVYMYKWNNRPLLVEFSIFTGIHRDTFYNWINGVDNNIAVGKVSGYLTRERSDVVRKWADTCERGLLDGTDTIKDIFILKAKYNYKEAGNNEISINVNHKMLVNADTLPDLIGLKEQ